MLPTNTIGGTQKPESHYACVVYDRSTGQIHHIHQVINLPGARAPSKEEMEQRALHHTPKGAPTGLAVLVLSSTHVERGKSYRVDHGKQALVAVSK
jgi:hypothetical protein